MALPPTNPPGLVRDAEDLNKVVNGDGTVNRAGESLPSLKAILGVVESQRDTAIGTIDGYVSAVDSARGSALSSITSSTNQVTSARSSALNTINQAEDDVQGELSDAVERIEQDGRDAAASTGWFVVGDFADGFEFTARNQVGRDSDGELWSYNGAELPFTVTAGTVPSEPEYTNRGDAALRSALANEGGASLVRDTVFTVDSLVDLPNVPQREGQQVSVSGSFFSWDAMGQSWRASGSISSRVFGIIPSSGGETPVSLLQEAVDYCAERNLELIMEPGHYFGNASANDRNEYVPINIPSNFKISAYGANFQDFVWFCRDKENIQFRGGRYYNKSVPAGTAWLFDINLRHAKFIDCHFDQELPADTVSPWIYLREFESPEKQCKDILFDNCKLTNRTNVQMWNCRDITIRNCDIRNVIYEDAWCIKSRKGFGVTENIQIIGGRMERASGIISAGTQIGDVVRNIKAYGVVAYDSARLLFIECRSNVSPQPQFNGGDVYDISVDNCDIFDSEARLVGGGASLRIEQGSTCERVRVSNCSISGRSRTNTRLFRLSTEQGIEGEDFAHINDVKFSSITYQDPNPGASHPGDIDQNGNIAEGFSCRALYLPESSFGEVTGVVFKDIKVSSCREPIIRDLVTGAFPSGKPQLFLSDIKVGNELGSSSIEFSNILPKIERFYLQDDQLISILGSRDSYDWEHLENFTSESVLISESVLNASAWRKVYKQDVPNSIFIPLRIVYIPSGGFNGDSSNNYLVFARNGENQDLSSQFQKEILSTSPAEPIVIWSRSQTTTLTGFNRHTLRYNESIDLNFEKVGNPEPLSGGMLRLDGVRLGIY